jgi:hypothetical protein
MRNGIPVDKGEAGDAEDVKADDSSVEDLEAEDLGVEE